VAATAKHFPGLGGAKANTDDAAVTVADPIETLRARDLPPFRAAIKAGVPLVMSSHARYPALDPDRIASQSKRILVDLLRAEMGFEGVVVTDSLEAEAVLEESDLEEAAVRSMAAGNDLLLTTGRGSSIRVYRAIVQEARRDPAFAARVREAASRVRTLTTSLGRSR
jgi:beta-N-acetylhexosaminidase